MRVVDVQPGAVGEDDVGQPEVLVGQLAGVGDLAGHVEPAGVAQRRLLLEVPPGTPGPQRAPRRRRSRPASEATIGLAVGWPCTEMPNSVSVPITRRTLMTASLRGRALARMGSMSEIVALVDRTGAVVGSAERSVVRRENLLHAATAVLVRDPARPDLRAPPLPGQGLGALAPRRRRRRGHGVRRAAGRLRGTGARRGARRHRRRRCGRWASRSTRTTRRAAWSTASRPPGTARSGTPTARWSGAPG